MSTQTTVIPDNHLSPDWQALPVMPKHLAVIMDGNGRWAKRQNLPRRAGHKAGVDAVRRLIQSTLRAGIPYLTLYAFSRENWQRPAAEVRFLMTLLKRALFKEVDALHSHGVRIEIIGDKTAFDAGLLQAMTQAESLTQHNTQLHLQLALNYSGHWEMTQACNAAVAASNHTHPSNLTESDFRAYLPTAHLPDPDLLIRTSGEKRLSNFCLWQLAYTELFFTDTLWPDFNETILFEALQCYASRARRFGGI